MGVKTYGSNSRTNSKRIGPKRQNGIRTAEKNTPKSSQQNYAKGKGRCLWIIGEGYDSVRQFIHIIFNLDSSFFANEFGFVAVGVTRFVKEDGESIWDVFFNFFVRGSIGHFGFGWVYNIVFVV